MYDFLKNHPGREDFFVEHFPNYVTFYIFQNLHYET